MITFVANGRTASYTSTDVITAGSVGIPVQFTLSEDFDGLSPIVVFEGSGTAVDVALVDNACVVPHEVVATAGGYLKIGIYARNGEGTIVIPTIWGNTCPILPGAAPSDVDPSQPTPDWTAQVQQIATDAYIKAEQAEGVANDAKSAAIIAQDSAQASAEAAQTAREGAEAAQGFAETAESNARGFASDAAGSAGDAAAAKTAAETAQGKAEDAQEAAEGYATTASNKAGEASQSAQDAQGYSNTASSKAGEAAQSEQNALGYANTASSKAGEAANSATAAGNSATAANADALKSEGFAVGEQNGTPVASGLPYYQNNAKHYAEQAEMAVQSGPITKTLTNVNPIAITDGADNVGVKQLLINIIPTQDGTGDPSPTNIRALSGWTGATLTVNGEDIGITFPAEAGTVYAGTLDVLTGVLTVGYAIETLTSEKTVLMDTNFYFLLGSAGRVARGKDGWCSHYKTVHPTSNSQLNATDYAMTFNNSSLTGVNGRCFLRDSRYTTVADLKAYWDAQKLAGTPVQVVYPIASPQTYQLTPQVVKTLLGNNSMSVDCGDLTLKYVVDLQTYVDDEAGALVEASDATTDTRINCEHGLVNYGYDNHVDKDVSNTGGLAGHLKRDFTVVEVTGSTSANNTASKIILSSPNLTGFAGSAADVDGLILTDGHKYRVRLHHISGTATNVITARAYKAKAISAVSDTPVTDPVTGDKFSDFVYDSTATPNGVYICLGLIRTSTGNTLTNYKCNVTLEDITNGDIPLRVGDNVAYASTIAIVCPGDTAPQAITAGQYLVWQGALYTATVNIASGEALSTSTNVAAVQDGGLNDVVAKTPVQDVQINGTSILSDGVANVPVMDSITYGVSKLGNGLQIQAGANLGRLAINRASSANIKTGTEQYRPITPIAQHESVFYGLASAAGDSSQSASSNTVGTYTESAKSAIAGMLDAPETVIGSTPSITAKSGVRYICGECSTLTITVPASGCIDVMFESGSTPTVLTVTSAKTGVTAIKWANGFDPTALEADTTYEINILDGEFGVVGSWT